MYDAKGGRRVDQMRTPADKGEGARKGGLFADVLYGRPLTTFPLPFLAKRDFVLGLNT